MSRKEKIILLIDGNALIHRAYHAIPPLTTPKGELVNAVFGFSSVLFRAIKELKPCYIVVAFDKKAPTFRHKIFTEYKATRPKGDKELYRQFPKVREVVEALNIPHFEIAGYEADDILGTLKEKAKDKKIKSIIVTGDMDAMQLVDDNTNVYTLKKGVNDTILFSKKQVLEKYGLKPDQLVDYKALRGDPSDNIPGVKGIGEKTAVKLLQEYGNLEKLYKALESGKKVEVVKPRIIDLLIKNKEQAFLSQRLAKIITDINFNFDLEKCDLKDYDREKVIKLFQELGFKSLINRLPESKKKEHQVGLFDMKKDKDFNMIDWNKKKEVDYKLIESQQELDKIISELKLQKEFAFDTETTSKAAHEAELVGISFCWQERQSYYIQVFNSRLKFDELKNVLENQNIKKICQNLKYDLLVMENFGINVKNASFDTMLASYVLNPGTRRHSLDDLAFSEFGYEMMSFDELVGPAFFKDLDGNKKKTKKDILEVDVKKLAWYSCEDVDFTFRLFKKFSDKLEKEKKLKEVLEKIEVPLVSVLSKMEDYGIKIDVDFLKKLSKQFGERIIGLESEIFKMAGCRFNVRSTLQLKEVLFDKLKLETQDIKKIKTGFSTAASELEKLRQIHPIIALIEEHRELSKLKSTYLDALPELVTSDERVHTSFNQTITATGRLSSSDPNLQNIPIKTDVGQQIRKAFIAERGNKLIAADYSQIELRIMAHVSGDTNMIKAFEAGEDIHTATAAKIFKKDLKEISDKERRVAKTINFGIMYGMSAHGLSLSLGIPREEAQTFINEYFAQFSTIAVYVKQTLDFSRANGYVETLFGRRRYLPELNDRAAFRVRMAGERMAINMPIQGTAADIIKLAMIEINKKIGNNKEVKMILQVHDELVFEVKENLVDAIVKEVKEIMENIYKLEVPLVVDIGVGDNWGETK
ncbi:MAG: DNA polymerase I [Patescibacteria group bacterium]|nr:DNA polymerase I [Patescibacteria group bacterium]